MANAPIPSRASAISFFTVRNPPPRCYGSRPAATAGVRQLSKSCPQSASPTLWAALSWRSVVGLRGLEPRASSLSGKRSNRLSYNPINSCLTCGNKSSHHLIVPSWRFAPIMISRSLPGCGPPAMHGKATAAASGRGHGPTSIRLAERPLHAAYQSRDQVVDDRADGRHRRDQDDVGPAEDRGDAKHLGGGVPLGHVHAGRSLAGRHAAHDPLERFEHAERGQ